jgi:hypothetical protein
MGDGSSDIEAIAGEHPAEAAATVPKSRLLGGLFREGSEEYTRNRYA